MKRIILPLLMLCLVGTAFANQTRIQKDITMRKTHTQKQMEQELASIVNANMKAGRHRVSTWMDTDWALQFENYYAYNTNGEIAFIIRNGANDTPQIRMYFSYDISGNMTERITHDYMSGGIWKESQKINISYNAEGELNSIAYYTYINNQWVQRSGHRTLLEYDAVKNLYSETNQYWDKDSTKYLNIEKVIYQLDASNNPIFSEYYYIINNKWSPSSRYEYTYNANHELSVSHFYVPGNQANEWIVTERDTLISWNNGKLLSFTTQDNIAGIWTNRELLNYTYSDFNTQTLTTSIYNGVEWVFSQRSHIAYNEKGDQTAFRIEDWVDTEWKESFGMQYHISYDHNENKTEIIVMSFDGTNYTNLYREEYLDYFTINGIKQTASTKLIVYPNPSSDFIYLKQNKSTVAESILISDLNGKTMKVISENLSEKLDISDLNSGIYIIQLKTKNETTFGKFIKN